MEHDNGLFTLISDGKVKAYITAHGFSKSALTLIVHNVTSDELLRLEIPEGSVFVADSRARIQPLVTRTPATIMLQPGEEHALSLDVFCGDSGASVPAGGQQMLLSPYSVAQEHLANQVCVWRWSAPFQPAGKVDVPAFDAYCASSECEAARHVDLHLLRHQLEATTQASAARRQHEVVALLSDITAERRRIKESRKSRSGGSGGSSSGSVGFGGGCSSGGGSGCSW